MVGPFLRWILGCSTSQSAGRRDRNNSYAFPPQSAGLWSLEVSVINSRNWIRLHCVDHAPLTAPHLLVTLLLSPSQVICQIVTNQWTFLSFYLQTTTQPQPWRCTRQKRWWRASSNRGIWDRTRHTGTEPRIRITATMGPCRQVCLWPRWRPLGCRMV